MVQPANTAKEGAVSMSVIVKGSDATYALFDFSFCRGESEEVIVTVKEEVARMQSM